MVSPPTMIKQIAIIPIVRAVRVRVKMFVFLLRAGLVAPYRIPEFARFVK